MSREKFKRSRGNLRAEKNSGETEEKIGLESKLCASILGHCPSWMSPSCFSVLAKFVALFRKMFIDALASLFLMTVTHSQTDWKLTVLYHLRCHYWDWDIILSLRMECHSKLNVTQNGMSLKKECHSEWNIAQNWMSLKMDRHSKWNVTQHVISLKMECHSKWNVTENEMSLKMECHSKWKVPQNGRSLKMEGHSSCKDTQNGISLKVECH